MMNVQDRKIYDFKYGSSVCALNKNWWTIKCSPNRMHHVLRKKLSIRSQYRHRAEKISRVYYSYKERVTQQPKLPLATITAGVASSVFVIRITIPLTCITVHL